MKKINFLGLSLVNANFFTFIEQIKADLKSEFKNPKIVFTPNPEMYVEMRRNENFAGVLKKADYLIPDGFGILVWSKLLFGQKFKERLTGVDLTEDLLSSNYGKVYIVGGQPGAACIVAEKFNSVVGFYDGKVNDDTSSKIIDEINSSGAEIVLVALGAPKQEFWIMNNLNKFVGVKLLCGIGGSIDFLAGFQKRAPMVFRKLGIEWLWRVILEPKRIGRIWRATVVFSLLCLKKRFGLKDIV